MKFTGLLIAAGVLLVSAGAEGQIEPTQHLAKMDKGVMWVNTGGEVPANAIRSSIDKGSPLCRGTMTEERGGRNWWKDIGVYLEEKGVCHTQRKKDELRFQEKCFFLVPASPEEVEQIVTDMVADGTVVPPEVMIPLEEVLQMREDLLDQFEAAAEEGSEAVGSTVRERLVSALDEWREYEPDEKTLIPQTYYNFEHMISGARPGSKTGPSRSKTGPPRSKTGPPRSKTR